MDEEAIEPKSPAGRTAVGEAETELQVRSRYNLKPYSA